MPKAFRVVKETNQFIIQTNKVPRGGNVYLNPLNEPLMEPHNFQSSKEKTSFNRIISFHNVYFHHTILLTLHPPIIVVKEFLAKKDIISNATTTNKSYLGIINDLGKHPLILLAKILVMHL